MSKELPRETHNLQELGSLLRYQRLREAPGYKGKIYEDIVEKALQLMVEKGEISGFLRTERHSELDKKQIDFLILKTFDQEIPLQVTSTRPMARRHKRKNPLVPVVRVVTEEGRIREPEEMFVFIRKILKTKKFLKIPKFDF